MTIITVMAAGMVARGCARPPGLWAGPAWGQVVAPVAMAAMAVAGPAPVVGRVADRVVGPVAAGTVVLAAVVPAGLVVESAPAQDRLLQAHPVVVVAPEAGRTVPRVVVAPKVRRAAERPDWCEKSLRKRPCHGAGSFFVLLARCCGRGAAHGARMHTAYRSAALAPVCLRL